MIQLLVHKPNRQEELEALRMQTARIHAQYVLDQIDRMNLTEAEKTLFLRKLLQQTADRV